MGIDLGDPINLDPVPLLDGKWMIGRFQFDVRAHAVIPKMSACLEVFRTGIERKFGREPAEEWTNVRPVVRFETRNELVEMVLAEGYPNSPDERLGFAMHRNLQALSREEMLTIDNTSIGAQGAPAGVLFSWNGIKYNGALAPNVGIPSCHSPQEVHLNRNIALQPL